MNTKRARRMIQRGFGLFFAVAAMLKLYNPEPAIMGLETLGIAEGVARTLISVVIVVELYVAVLLTFQIDSSYAVRVASFLLLLFTAYLFYLTMLADPPPCGCLGQMGLFSSNKSQAWFGLLRNCALLWLLRFAAEPPAPQSIVSQAAG